MNALSNKPSFNFDDTPIIDNKWVLRNDGNYLVVYKLSTSESKFILLPPCQSIIAAIIDGNTNFSNLCKNVKYVFGLKDDNEALNFLNSAINTLNKQDTVISRKSSTNCSNIFDTRDYFIPLETYKLPKNSRLKLPLHIRLVTTERCQTDCVYCYVDKINCCSSNALTNSAWADIIDFCVNEKILNIELAGGDLFADKQSIEIILILLKSKIPVFISTKSLITKEILSDLSDAGFNNYVRGIPNTIQLSVDATVPALADKLTNSSGYLYRVEKNIKNCLKYNIRPKIKSVLTKLNYQELIPIIKKYSNMGIINFQFVCYGLSYFRPREDLLLTSSEKEYIHTINEEILKNQFTGLDITVQDEFISAKEESLSFEEKKRNWTDRARCSGGYSSMTILPNGKIILCEQMPRSNEFFIGDVNNFSIPEIWTSKYIENWLFPYQEKFKDTVCYTCHEFKNCIHNAGWCYRDSLFAYDTMYEANPKCPYQTKVGRNLV